MENENLIKTVTNGEVTAVPFGGDIPALEFSISEWQAAYLINGSYTTRNPDGSIRTDGSIRNSAKRDWYKNSK